LIVPLSLYGLEKCRLVGPEIYLYGNRLAATIQFSARKAHDFFGSSFLPLSSDLTGSEQCFGCTGPASRRERTGSNSKRTGRSMGANWDPRASSRRDDACQASRLTATACWCAGSARELRLCRDRWWSFGALV